MRIFIGIVAALALLGSLAVGGISLFLYLRPSDELQLYEQKYGEAVEKLKQAEAAQGSPAEAALRQEAKEASDSARVWGEGARDRRRSHRLAVIASAALALLSAVVLRLTLRRRPITPL
jgi:hypothetical protein